MMLSQTPKLGLVSFISDFFGATHLTAEVARSLLSESREHWWWIANHSVGRIALWICALLFALRYGPRILRGVAHALDELCDLVDSCATAVVAALIAPLTWLLRRAWRGSAHALRNLRRWQLPKSARSMRISAERPVRASVHKRHRRGRRKSAPRKRQSQPRPAE